MAQENVSQTSGLKWHACGFLLVTMNEVEAWKQDISELLGL
uniref:Acyl-coenzyme A binding domain containing n=1 Tax=Rhizophora mucronata TaxID=61149 RepID=A0A2P2JCC5_RHIMU